MNKYILIIIFFGVYQFCSSQNKKTVYGPVFNDIGATFEIENADFTPDSTAVLKAIFDIDYLPKDKKSSNALIASLHRYLNIHVKSGVKESNISLAFVLHGASTKDALKNEIYKEKYGTDNPNIHLIKTLSKHGVDMADNRQVIKAFQNQKFFLK